MSAIAFSNPVANDPANSLAPSPKHFDCNFDRWEAVRKWEVNAADSIVTRHTRRSSIPQEKNFLCRKGMLALLVPGE